jgi:hypothetical protein
MTRALFLAAAAITGTLLMAAPPVAAQAQPEPPHLFVRAPKFVIEEYQLVKPGKEQEIIDYYRRKVEPVLKTYPGYLGMSVVTADPSGIVKDPEIAKYVGLPHQPILPHLGVMMDGAVRTDRQINFHSMLRGAYTIVFHHYIADEATLKSIMQGHDVPGGDASSFPARWRQRYGNDVWDTLAKEYFVNLVNHYDVIYVYAQPE